MVLLKSSYAIVSYYPDESLMELKWLRQTSDKEFKKTFTFCMDTVLKEDVKYFLSDNLAGNNLALSIQHWVSTYAGSHSKQLKLKRYARVVPPDAFQEVVSYKMYDLVKRIEPIEIEFMVFYTKDAALRWLLNGAQLSA